MIDVRITPLPAAPLHVLEIWSQPDKVASECKKALQLTLPAMGQSATQGGRTLMRFEPTVWLVEGPIDDLVEAIADHGSLTANGGGLLRVELSGPGWRRLLMEGGVFDAESMAFCTGCCAATVIDHVNVRLYVDQAERCIAYVPSSYSQDMLDFWAAAIRAN